jgi:ribosomal-protein-alanine N-acetyltransferase
LRLETERLILRPFEPGDAEDLHVVRSDPSTFEYLGSAPAPATKLEDTRAQIARLMEYHDKHGFGIAAVVERASGRVIGDCGLQLLEDGPEVEVGYKLGRQYRGRGYATEAARAWLEYGFDTLGLERIVAVAWPDNVASWRVMEKCGMRRVGPGEHYGHETVLYEITRAGRATPAG